MAKKETKTAVKTGAKLSKATVGKNVKATSKKVAEVVRRTVSSEQYKGIAKTVEAVMAALIQAETGEIVKGTNLVQALGQGQLQARDENGQLIKTASNQLKGYFAGFDGENGWRVTAATFGADTPLDACFTRNGLARIVALSTNKLCNDPANQEMVDAIYGAIAKRYPEAVKALPAATRAARGEKKPVENPNKLFA